MTSLACLRHLSLLTTFRVHCSKKMFRQWNHTHLSSVTPLKNSIRNVRSFWIPVGLNTSNTLCSYKTLLFNHYLKEKKIKFQTLVSFFPPHFSCPVCSQLLKTSDDYEKERIPGILLFWKQISFTINFHFSVVNKMLNQQKGAGFN